MVVIDQRRALLLVYTRADMSRNSPFESQGRILPRARARTKSVYSQVLKHERPTHSRQRF